MCEQQEAESANVRLLISCIQSGMKQRETERNASTASCVNQLVCEDRVPECVATHRLHLVRQQTTPDTRDANMPPFVTQWVVNSRKQSSGWLGELREGG